MQDILKIMNATTYLCFYLIDMLFEPLNEIIEVRICVNPSIEPTHNPLGSIQL